MKYNPEQELTDTELNCLDEKDFFEYLDSKAQYLKQYTRPLESYHTKRFASIAAAMEGREFTDKELKTAREIGNKNFQERMEKEAEMEEKLGGDPKYKDEGIKNFKTHRSQWFD
jgi:DNA-directed RNA polymerase alpha subunit